MPSTTGDTVTDSLDFETFNGRGSQFSTKLGNVFHIKLSSGELILEKKITLTLCKYFFLRFQYELLFCIEDKDDPAIAIVNTLMEKYPLVDAHLFLGGSVVGVNPKINNMQPGYEAAKYEYIMISDSGIRSKF